MTGTDSITIMRSKWRRLAKTIHADGTIQGYDDAKTFDLIEVPVGDLAALRRLLQRLEHRPDCTVVRGAIADQDRTRHVRRLKRLNGGDLPTLIEVPRLWVALDFDTLPRPDWMDPSDLLGCACVAIRKLPVEFHNTTFLVQATASHGLKPGINIRLWAWLDRPVSGTELKYWLRDAPVDDSLFVTNQVTYTAAPVFLPGSYDPLQRRLDIIHGCDAVPVSEASQLNPPPPPRRYTRQFHHNEPERERSIAGLIRIVDTARAGNRNKALYWAACRLDENIDSKAAQSLINAAVRAGLSEAEAIATVRSALRQGGDHG
jgi:hypothetical protein